MVETGGLEMRFAGFYKWFKTRSNPLASQDLADFSTSPDFPGFRPVLALCSDKLVTVTFVPAQNLITSDPAPQGAPRSIETDPLC